MKIKVTIYLHLNIFMLFNRRKNLSKLYINSIELIGYCHIITNINFYDGYHGHHKNILYITL
jgi:hypothetical protein